jgi:FtsP/CotA-like multicopper oxidase with cupredoxin domain
VPETSSDAPFIAPTIRVFPGETVRLKINNDLPVEPDCGTSDHNTPHCFNTTNMHAHGLWVSPSGNSDNVLLSIPPKVEFEYEYNIPANHPSGTFWYHPHRHGSTAIQVGSGMAGALIVEGKRLPTPTSTGDIDTLLTHSDGVPFNERILVFQQIPYACRDADGVIKKGPGGRWLCEAGDVGQVDKHDDIFTPTAAWRLSGRFTTINGRTMEPLAEHATVGRIERWRMIHAGVRATIKLQFRKRLPGSTPVDGLAPDDHAVWIDANCDSTQVLDQWEIAADGLTREQAAVRKSTFLQPGYRSDILVVFPTAGDYCVVDEEAPAPAAINGVSGNRQLLTVVTVDAGQPVQDSAAHLKQELKAAARVFMPADVRQRIEEDLENGLRLTSFVPHGDLRGATPSSTQRLLFAANPSRIGNDASDLQRYDPKRIDRTLTLGAIEDWSLQSQPIGAPHPFHIHVNPFQVLSVIGEGNVDLTEDPTSEYSNLKGVWKDTLLVQARVTVTVRTQYRRYIGDFVLHCHILDHEDTGMMQNIRIVLPGGQGL